MLPSSRSLARRAIHLTLAALLTLRSGRAVAQSTPQSAKGNEVAVASGRDWLDAWFPAIALDNTGCTGTDRLPGGEVRRWYQWQVTSDFGDQQYANNHFMSAILFFGLTESAPLTDARLDSAIAATPITVGEAMGEPALTRRKWSPKRAWARRENGRLHLRVEGKEAVRAFLRTRADSVTVLWCQRDDIVSAIQTRLQRR